MSSSRFSCVAAAAGPPGIVLDVFSGLVRLYPWILRASLVLHRLVQ